MQWRGERRSDNVEDRRGMRVPGGGRGLGIGVVLLALVAWFLGGDPLSVLGVVASSGDGTAVDSGPARAPAADDEPAQFVSAVLASTEDVWGEIFSASGQTYERPKLVIFEEAVASACGTTSSAVGPFYCPGDAKVYLDLGFFEELHRRLGAPGDFAEAYVIAHEVGHHVQNLLGISDQVHALQLRAGEVEGNQLSVRLELQADFLAGVWAKHADRMRHVLDQGDIEEAVNAAGRIGDDVLQRQSTGRVRPDAFTHGTAAQRVRWFRKGLESGRVADGDTFAAKDL